MMDSPSAADRPIGTFGNDKLFVIPAGNAGIKKSGMIVSRFPPKTCGNDLHGVIPLYIDCIQLSAMMVYGFPVCSRQANRYIWE
jgi:hypothetical protein